MGLEVEGGWGGHLGVVNEETEAFARRLDIRSQVLHALDRASFEWDLTAETDGAVQASQAFFDNGVEV